MAMTDPDTWSEVERHFAELTALPANQRNTYLNNITSYNTKLHNELVSLLSAHEEAGDFLSGLDTKMAASLVREAEAIPVNSRIGVYKLIRELGRGGMGIVYLAQRDDGQFEQQVALKVIRQSIERNELQRHFLNERQILAQLQHPNIARLLDGGVSEDGQPYYAMEYIEGVSLLRYCDEMRLDIEARLRLFLKVCRAIAYAHSQLVIHRDLKPSNILVNNEGEIKLVDFGIAKLLDDERMDAAQTLMSQHQQLYTPEYASPEQMRGDPITTAVDIYALGVILYELLSGFRPYQFERSSLQQMVKLICEIEPPKPSLMLQSLMREEKKLQHDHKDRGIAALAKQRRVTPLRLMRKLKGDLDMIAMKALQKSPERRYPVVQALLDDVDNYLSGLPVKARPDSFFYLSGKLIKRHSIATVSVVTAVLSIFIGTVLIQQYDQRALRESEKADAVSAFINEILASADPAEVQGKRDISLDILDTTVLKLDSPHNSFAKQPEMEASIRFSLGRLYFSLGHYDKAEPQLNKAVAIQKLVLGNEHPDTLKSVGLLASVHREQNHYRRAMQLTRQTISDQEASSPATVDETLTINLELASLYRDTGKYQQAEQLYMQLLQQYTEIHGELHPGTLDVLDNIATLQRRLGNYRQSEISAIQALTGFEKLYGGKHPDTLLAKSNLARIYKLQGRYEQAKTLSVDTLSQQKEVLGGSHPQTLMTMENLSTIYRKLGYYEKAKQIATAALELEKQVVGEDHRNSLWGMSNLALIYQDTGDFESAKKLYQLTLQKQQTLLGSKHRHTLMTMRNLANLQRKLGEYEESETLHLKLLPLHDEHLGQYHPDTFKLKNNLAILYRKQGLHDKAEKLLKSFIHEQTERYGGEHPDTLRFKYNLAMAYLGQERFNEATSLIKEILDALSRTQGDDSLQYAVTLRGLAIAHHRWGDTQKAETLYRRSYELLSKKFGDHHPETLSSKERLAKLYRKTNRFAEAEALYLTLLKIRHRNFGDGHPFTRRTLRELVKLYKRSGNDENARIYRRRLKQAS